MSALDDALFLTDAEKTRIKILMLEVLADSVRDADNFVELCDKYRELVRGL